jgi:hypothetical protein
VVISKIYMQEMMQGEGILFRVQALACFFDSGCVRAT